jgi:hypothetical protein
VPDDVFAALYRETADLAAPGVSDVRTRARRHTRNRRWAATAATIAVLIVVAGGVAFAGRGTGPEPPPPLSSAEPAPTATGAPSPAPSAASPSTGAPSSAGTSLSRPPLTKVSASAMLLPEDLGAGWRSMGDDNDSSSGDWVLGFLLGFCPDWMTNNAYPATEPTDTRDRVIVPNEPADPPLALMMYQRTALYGIDGQAQAKYDWEQRAVNNSRSLTCRWRPGWQARRRPPGWYRRRRNGCAPPSAEPFSGARRTRE